MRTRLQDTDICVLIGDNRSVGRISGFQKVGHMDQDTYEQLIQIRISLDELNEKMNLVLDEIDELKKNMEEKPCGHLTVEQQRAHAQERMKCDMSKPGCRVPVGNLQMC